MTGLDVNGLTGGYSRATVLRDISLQVRPDEIVALLGANGAGKTSLLRGLSGTLPVCKGDVLLDGERLSRKRPWDRVKAGLAHVPEGRHVFSAMTVRENLEVAGLVAQKQVAHDQIFELFPRLWERRDQKAGTMSGGEQQMVAIARALFTGPQVLLIDEMSAGLAPVLVEQLVEALQRLRGTGLGILLVEQSPHFVDGVVDRVYLLERGQVVAEGTLEQLGGAERITERYLAIV